MSLPSPSISRVSSDLQKNDLPVYYRTSFISVIIKSTVLQVSHIRESIQCLSLCVLCHLILWSQFQYMHKNIKWRTSNRSERSGPAREKAPGCALPHRPLYRLGGCPSLRCWGVHKSLSRVVILSYRKPCTRLFLPATIKCLDNMNT